MPNAKKPKTAVSGAGSAGGTARKRSKTEEELLDTGGGDIVLPREEEGRTPVYMTCDEVRRSMRALLAKGVSQAALARALSGMFPADSGKVVPTSNLRYFLEQKGPSRGNTTAAFYAGYCFFEKQRIKNGKPKSAFRKEMEEQHGAEGVDTVHGANTYYAVSGNTRPIVDKYAKLRLI